ncbi:hypothetical protein [Campylobacter insulaenigrae]|uniref:hypothetical protein n=1 Tax=Campylobacter insulaenigrae TaxID=260714 RepID=UPI0021538910|nr:hypothetical protein [Campylobacter insulaenigrae]MCR6572273.1 hypothetical protein [Campylobacter insulaenigrae]MCR6581521.1 hypothetical protein [Campylobacter insulaenigrae]MCR6586244.1 hypothetical protein [Campylobacter insulaenigrae]
MEQTQNIKEIILHKDDGLLQAIQSVTNDDEIELKEIQKILLEVDYHAVGLNEYDLGLLTDLNRGHWDIYRRKEGTSNTKTIKIKDGELIARSPLLEIKKGVVAIDFGTKSTAAGFLDQNSHKQLMRIGSGNRNIENKKDYENPTIIEFVDIDSFMRAYHYCKSRPYTKFNDISVSHSALRNLESAKDDDFYRFFSNLKQWAGSSENKFRIKDAKGLIKTLKDFVECGEKDLNPIEIYAYYIGRYINNMYSGIYLEYLLSFPVKYSLQVRNKIKESFERGIKRSIPFAVLCSEEFHQNFEVILSASEPAAYAISALKEYGFVKKDIKELVHYGVFDFGGGTTDFDFGILRKSKSKKYHYDIEHFGADGDQYLGGENLLEYLVYEIVKTNKDELIKENISFTKPINAQIFGGHESVIKDSQEARKNTSILKETLRPLWENLGNFEDLTSINDLSKFGKIEQDDGLKIKIPLNRNDDGNGDTKEMSLAFDLEKLITILETKINEGVDKFYQAFKKAAPKMEGLKTLNIFLGGNSSRSILVKQAFEKMINEAKENKDVTEYVIFPPLGTQEADEMIKELKGEEALEQDLSKKVTCKTGVVFGLLDGRKRGNFNIISEVGVDDEAKFNYYIGTNDGEDNFEMIIDKDSIDVNSGELKQLFDYADMDEFEIYYTKDSRASTNELPISEANMTTLRLDKAYKEDDAICIKITAPDTIKHCVCENGKVIKEFEETKLK